MGVCLKHGTFLEPEFVGLNTSGLILTERELRSDAKWQNALLKITLNTH